MLKQTFSLLLIFLFAAVGCATEPPSADIQPTITTTSPKATPVSAEFLPDPASIENIIGELEGLPINEFFEKSYNHILFRNPEYLTFTGIGDFYGYRNNQLNNLSEEFIRDTQELHREVLHLLHGYDRSLFSSEDRLSIQVYEWYLDDLIDGHEFMYHNYFVHHFLGSYHEELIRLFTELHPIENQINAEDYISRLSQVDTQMNQVITGLVLRQESGVLPPDFILELTITDINRYLRIRFQRPDRVEAINLTVFTEFVRKVEALSDLTVEEKGLLIIEAQREIERSFIPAFLRLRDYLEDSLEMATGDAGLWKLPNGEAYYDYLLQNQAQTKKTAQVIHALGLSEVDRITQEINALFGELGYPREDSLGTKMVRAAADGGFYDLSTQSLKDDYVNTLEGFIDEIDLKLENIFDIQPRADVIVFGDPFFGGFYVPSSFDGSRPGAFHAYIGNNAAEKYSIPTVTYHEANPGHHFQIAIAQELDLPIFRNDIFFNAYGEGWALYAERLAWELGAYDDDPYGNLGRLQFELLRAVRLVTDTGIHSQQWTREQAQHYMNTTLGISGRFTHEVDRYIVRPAQALGYKLGMMTILDLRQRASDALGPQFDLKEFHSVVLGNGSLPLEILEQVVDDYIAGTLGS